MHAPAPASNNFNGQSSGYNSQASHYPNSQYSNSQPIQAQGNPYSGSYNTISPVPSGNIQANPTPIFNSNNNNNYQNPNQNYQIPNNFQNPNLYQNQNNFPNVNQNNFQSQNSNPNNFQNQGQNNMHANPGSFNQYQQYSSPAPSQNLNQTSSPTPMSNGQNWGGNNFSGNNPSSVNSAPTTPQFIPNPQTNYNQNQYSQGNNNFAASQIQSQANLHQPGHVIKLNITLPSESNIVLELPGTDTLFQVRQHVQKLGRAWSYSPFTLVRQNPRIVYNEQHMSLTLYDLGLSPECYIKCTLGVFHS